MSNALAISVQSWRYLRPFQDSSLLSTMKSSPPDLVGSFWSPVGIRKARVHQRAAGCNEFDLRAASPGGPLGPPLVRRHGGGGGEWDCLGDVVGGDFQKLFGVGFFDELVSSLLILSSLLG